MHIGANRGRLRQVLCHLTTKLLRLGKVIIENVIEKLGEGVSFETLLTVARDSSLKCLGGDSTTGLVKISLVRVII